MVKKWDFEAEKYPNNFLEIKYPTLFLFLMAIIGLFQCDPWLERIYNPITAMGFSAMFTFQLDNTKR